MSLSMGNISWKYNRDAYISEIKVLARKLPVLLLLLITGCSDQPGNQSLQGPAEETAIEHAKKHFDKNYVCPMHPDIVRDSEGSCPICGMDLVEKQKPRRKESSSVVELDSRVVQKLGIKTESVQKSRLWKYIRTVGYVTYDDNRVTTIYAPADGWIENLAVRREGLAVEKGQLLLELYAPEFLSVQKDFIAQQKKDHSGTLKKYGQRQESVEARDQLRYMGISDSLANEIARSGKPRHRIPVYTHQFGNVISLDVRKHEYVFEAEPMMTIADLSSVWIEANVYEHQLEWVKRKQSVVVTVPALPGKKWRGIVSYIFPELDPTTRSLKVRLRVPNYDSQLKPNMYAQVEILGGAGDEVINVSRQSVIVTGERESVIIDTGDGKFQPVDVVTGMRSKGRVEIIKGLDVGDKVVTSGQFLIDSEANLQASFERLGSE